MSGWLSMSQACAHLGISRSTLYRMCRDGRLSGRTLPGVRGLSFQLHELDALQVAVTPKPANEVAPAVARRRRGSI